MNDAYSKYQFDDLKGKGADLYASTKYAIIGDMLSKHGKLRILNAGCGSGELSFLLASDGHTVHGIDPTDAYIALAQRHRAVSGASFEVSSIEAFEPRELFGAVVATDVLEHIKDDRAALARLASFVRPGGIVVITVPALPILFGYHDRMLGHFRRYTKASFRALTEGAGLNIKKVRYFGFTLIPISVLYSKMLKKPYPVSLKSTGIAGRFRQAALHLLLAVDRNVSVPFGTSLIGVFRKP